ncbi:MAG TPA: peptide ABC transporter substrate-binding protein [Chloroflexota bacterium]|nr:peptide ABC transporter substrate-binding protein [Chloroflexota bacterium]
MNQTGAPSANDTWRTSAPSGPERPRMQRHRPLRRRVPVWLAVTMLALAACAPAAQAPQSAVRAGGPAASAVPQRALVIAYPREPVALEPSLLPQNREESALASAFLAYFTPQQQAAPYLAEELPSVDKGTWKIFSDGTMETTYKLRSNARWHDGEPLTADDFVFAHTVRMDPAYPAVNSPLERRMSEVRAVDDHTLVMEWKDAYMWAGMIPLPYFSPMPRHKLESLYTEDIDQFITGSHWRNDFVGAGPYRVERWDPGVEIVFAAHPDFFLGKPHIPEIHLKFITDANTVVATLLGGAADVAFNLTIGFPQAQALEQANWNGKIEYWEGNPRIIEFQSRDWGDTQRAVFDVRVRRAALHAIDRQGIVDAIFAGHGHVQHFWLPPSDPAFPAVDHAVTKYEYDPGRAEALLREAGWTKGPDGIARNAAGEPLDMPMLNQPTEVEQQEAAIVVDEWKDVGIGSEIRRLATSELRNGELRSKFRAVAYSQRSMTLENMVWVTPNLSGPENRWNGQDRNGYTNPQLDDLWGRMLGSIDPHEREGLLIDALKVMTDDAAVTPTHIQPAPTAYSAGLSGPKEPSAVGTATLWNVWEWQWQ